MGKTEANMKTNKITFGVANTMLHHQRQLERKVQEIQALLVGRNHPLLPENWTDEDAWALARDLANLMTLVKRVNKTVFDKENPYPNEDTPLEDIPYYNPYFPEDGPPEDPVELWTEVLHCGILIAAANPDFCFPSNGTFADLEELFLGVLRGGAGPVLQFSSFLLDRLQETLSIDRFRMLQEMDFGPEPPSFEETKDSNEKFHQDAIYAWWQEWEWLRRCPCRSELQKAIQKIQSEKRYGQAMSFVHWEVGLADGLRQAINLYLYQAGASGMMDESYFVTYAMLCRTQKQMLAAMAAEEEAP